MKELLAVGLTVLLLASGSKTDGNTDIPGNKVNDPNRTVHLSEFLDRIESEIPRRDEFPMHPSYHGHRHENCKNPESETVAFIMPHADEQIFAPEGFVAGKGDFMLIRS